uniref:Phenylalanine--tRNA ligase beta subunit n=1 Tax=Candidatus Kentrum sp. MB TaxID=2138164 RepID=A0A451BAL1_9GAMM|nr:MAG: phenylalanyl-tRNA synthetase beta subunit [Candidatus Kentron sp. MB]VFK30605.1 MAG: phenylalanyl-tRNA synthetase beta subunit [Candidatus Kentron sp. MB]VFK75317.1 MAG: phenylalanyl-tRNA synthetase beta subunit [Candidatus Kentron sp. MB]
MQFSEKWLREWVNPSISTDELAAQLTALGLEVDSVQPAAPDLEGVVVGKVLSVSRHPNADRLTVCSVDAGSEASLTIVCGASNVREGLRAPVAGIGARLADGSRMKRARIRGQESQGMLCSAEELGLAESADGLMELPPDAPVGQAIFDYFDFGDVRIEVDLTPNRGDCLSVAGIAREIGVLNRCPLSSPEMAPIPSDIPDEFPVILDAPADCPRYVGRVVRDIDPKARTPLWMQERLRRSGVRSIGPVVDVTNYVLLELGQPMHAFDLDKLEGGIRVRKASQGETLSLLNGAEITLRPDTLVIADEHRPVALAGIMGGLDSAVTETTRDIFLESAFFAPTALAGQARHYALHTDSSHRFERGVDFERQRMATERATALLLEITGGKPGPIIERASQTDLPLRTRILLRKARLQRILGISPANETISDVLTRLGMTVRADSDNETWEVTPPGFRFDIAIEADLIEEIARVIGYDRIPVQRPSLPLMVRKSKDTVVSLASMRQVLVERGYREAITYSFVDPELATLMDAGAHESMLALQNPISTDMAIMRATLLPGLLQAALYNTRRQQSRVRLFESGLVFSRNRQEEQENEPIQERVLGGIAVGPAFTEQWGIPTRDTDFFDVKSDVEAVLSLTGQVEAYRFTPYSHPALHPGRSALIERTGDSVDPSAGKTISNPIGWIGNIHPRITRELRLSENTVVFQIAPALLDTQVLSGYFPLSKFPVIRRDIALILDAEVLAQSVQNFIGEIATDTLKKITLFDEYHGKGIGTGKKSLAFGLLFQDTSRTLQDAEIDALVSNIMTELQARFGAIPRT